jgi:hypothetical protein
MTDPAVISSPKPTKEHTSQLPLEINHRKPSKNNQSDKK